MRFNPSIIKPVSWLRVAEFPKLRDKADEAVGASNSFTLVCLCIEGQKFALCIGY